MSVESNRLGQETSPYLLQHQHNPVHWQAWSAETLALAKRSGRPVLLSVGYAACHWCHVMAHEIFRERRNRGADERIFRQCESGPRRATRRRSICINKR